jgi:hypothetical protein
VLNRFSEAIQQSRVDVVPRVVVSGGQGSEGGSISSNIMEGLLTMMLSDKLGVQVTQANSSARTPEVEEMRTQVCESLMRKTEGGTGTVSTPNIPDSNLTR